MRQEIIERMEKQIKKVRLYNEMFDAAVTTVETEVGYDATKTSENSYSIQSEIFKVVVNCATSDYYALTIIISDISEAYRYAEITVDGNGGNLNETYYNLPRTIRNQVYEITSSIADAMSVIFPDKDTSVNNTTTKEENE